MDFPPRCGMEHRVLRPARPARRRPLRTNASRLPSVGTGEAERARRDSSTVVIAWYSKGQESATTEVIPDSYPCRPCCVGFYEWIARAPRRKLNFVGREIELRTLGLASAVARAGRSHIVLERTERELAASGLASLRTTTRTPLRLTPQELATARLVTSGLTNREVTAELVVSVKTVEYHLANIYARLGVRNRRELRTVPAS